MADSNINSACGDRADDIQEYVDAIDQKLSEGKKRWADIPPGLRQELRNRLHSIKINCFTKEDGDCIVGIDGRVRDSQIYLCPDANEATLLHELVHANGGKELDSEALENHLYPGKGTDPSGDDVDKFLVKDKPCAYFEGKKQFLVAEYVIWNPRTGELWIREGTRTQPKRGKKLKPTFNISPIDKDKLKKNPPADCSMTAKAEKCGARCKDFETYGLCDRKVRNPPCYQHRAAV